MNGAWSDFLAATASGDFLHDWTWADVAAFDGQPPRRYVLEDDGAIVAIVAAQARQIFGGREFWYVPHGPVLDFDDPRAGDRVRALVIGLREVARQHRAIAIKLEPRLEMNVPALAAFEGRGLRHTDESLQVAHTRIVELPEDDDALLAGFDKDTRYSVRRAEREGVEVSVVEDGDAARDRRPARARGRDPGARRLPAAAARALPDRVERAVRRRPRAILEARREGELLASGMVVIEGDRSFYLFSGSRREERGEPKRFASYALQWAMMRLARSRGVRHHDLWGVAPPDAGAEHPWHGVGLFKKGFGGREVHWAGSWDLVVDPTLYRLRAATGIARGWLRGLRR